MKHAAAALAVALGLAQAAAAACPEAYVVKDGETVFTIAEAAYGDPEMWTLIYYANQEMLQASVFQVSPGDALVIPCAPGAATADATPLLQQDAELTLLTGSNYTPFTDRTWPGQGMVTELVNAALEATPDPVPYAINWNDTWSEHFPALEAKDADMGFPWLKPDCDSDPGNERCVKFHFSDPLVEVLVLLFVKADSGIAFGRDADVLGKRICRPEGYYTHDLDRPDRQWLSKGLVTLVTRPTPEGCFEALMAGQADAVSVNVFLGAEKVDAMGLRGQVVPLDRPLSVQTLHVIISKSHWRGTTFLYRFNAGLAALKDSDRYAQIVSKHLGIFWDRIGTGG